MARQRRRRIVDGESVRNTGMGVDRFGGPVVDPTENVLALVDVEKDHWKELRETDLAHDKELRDAESRYNDGMRQADNRRTKDLAELKQTYDKQISDILTVQVK